MLIVEYTIIPNAATGPQMFHQMGNPLMGHIAKRVSALVRRQPQFWRATDRFLEQPPDGQCVCGTPSQFQLIPQNFNGLLQIGFNMGQQIRENLCDIRRSEGWGGGGDNGFAVHNMNFFDGGGAFGPFLVQETSNCCSIKC